MTPEALSQLEQQTLQLVAIVGQTNPVTQEPGYSKSTLSSWRRAFEGFIEALKTSGHDLATLPPDFIEKHWMPTQASIINAPIQLRVRVGAVKRLLAWLREQGQTVADITIPTIKTPPPKKKEPTSTPVVPAPEAQTMTTPNDLMQFSEQNVPEGGIPTLPNVAVQPPTPRMPMQSRPANAPTKPVNPLMALLPTAAHRLRIWRERADGTMVFLSEEPADRVQQAGGVESFLVRSIAPRFKLAGELAFIVAPVDPNGAMAGRATISVMVPSAQEPEVVTPMSSPAPVPTPDFEREDRLQEMQSRQQSEMSELKSAVAGIAQAMSAMAERITTLASTPAPAPVPQQSNDLAGVLSVLAPLLKPPTPPPAPVAPPENSLAKAMEMMATMKDLFQPQNIAVDVSPLEQELKAMRAKVEKKDDLMDTVQKIKSLQELFKTVGPTGAPKPTSLSEALGAMVMKVADNPQPWLDAVTSVVGRTPQGEEQAEKRAANSPPPALVEATRQLLLADDEAEMVMLAHEWMGHLQQYAPTQKVYERLTGLLNRADVAGVGVTLRQVVVALGLPAEAPRIRYIADGLINRVKAAMQERQRQMQAQQQQAQQAQQAGAAGQEEGAEDEEEEAGEPDLTIRVGSAAEEQAEGDDEEEAGEDEAEDEEVEAEEAEEADDEQVEDADAEPEAEEEPEAEAEEAPEEVAEEDAETAALIEQVKQETKSRRRRSKKDAPTPPDNVIQLTDVAPTEAKA